MAGAHGEERPSKQAASSGGGGWRRVRKSGGPSATASEALRGAWFPLRLRDDQKKKKRRRKRDGVRVVPCTRGRMRVCVMCGGA